jgi:hypothetical protein
MTIGGQHARRELIDHIGEEVRNAARLIAVEAFE